MVCGSLGSSLKINTLLLCRIIFQELILSTIANLSDQIAQLRDLIETRKNWVNDAIDAWNRFIAHHANVTKWCEEKTALTSAPLAFVRLGEAKLRAQEYANALKSLKNVVGKSLTEMSRDLAKIRSMGSCGELADMWTAVEKAKNDAESELTEKNALLLELTEEWEQCERKLKETQAWTSKAKESIDALQSKKRSIKDQLALREKIFSDIAVQRKRAIMALEKLRVHFPKGDREQVGDSQEVEVLGKEIQQELGALEKDIRAQIANLEKCLDQLDNLNQVILHYPSSF